MTGLEFNLREMVLMIKDFIDLYRFCPYFGNENQESHIEVIRAFMQSIAVRYLKNIECCFVKSLYRKRKRHKNLITCFPFTSK